MKGKDTSEPEAAAADVAPVEGPSIGELLMALIGAVEKQTQVMALNTLLAITKADVNPNDRRAYEGLLANTAGMLLPPPPGPPVEELPPDMSPEDDDDDGDG